eukprot:TRINITY_DN15056_c0_g1_i2.p1 TRINITY_DN15056_c0_g1~~TRINITY_DN15056_c0_g1_i2.p1  ORF type:complete len:236 (-),score=21.53 TRINITY_DN15056_c0_g1_i2:75-755(-)
MSTRRVICFICCIFLILVGFAASVIGIARSATKTNPASPCPELPRLSQFYAEKKLLNRWHWTYQVNDYPARIQPRCPGTPLTDVWFKSKLATRERAQSGFGRETILRDCNNNALFSLHWSPRGWQFQWRSSFYYASYVLQEPNNGRPVAWSKASSKGFTDLLDISDFDTNSPVATASRKLLTVKQWRWVFTVHNLTHPAADPRVLLTLIGKISFNDAVRNVYREND